MRVVNNEKNNIDFTDSDATPPYVYRIILYVVVIWVKVPYDTYSLLKTGVFSKCIYNLLKYIVIFNKALF